MMGRKPNIQAFIQVRMDSSRLPGKALLDIDGKTAIERVVDCFKPSKFIKNTIITTTLAPEDNPLEELAKAKGISFFRGDKINLVKRFFDASKEYDADVIVRISGDCPFVSSEISDYLIDSHIKLRADYTGTEIEKIPVGVSPDIISRRALERLVASDISFEYSEYLTFYFTNNPDFFSLNIVPAPAKFQFPEYRLTLDYPNDLEMFNLLYKTARENGLAPELSNFLKVLKDNPEIAEINSGLKLKYKSDKILIERIKEAARIKVN